MLRILNFGRLMNDLEQGGSFPRNSADLKKQIRSPDNYLSLRLVSLALFKIEISNSVLMEDLAVVTAEYKETKRAKLRKTHQNKIDQAEKYKNYDLVTLAEAQTRQMTWFAMNDEEKASNEKDQWDSLS